MGSIAFISSITKSVYFNISFKYFFEYLSDEENLTAEKYRKHHIIPCFSFKDENHKTRKETLHLADKIENNITPKFKRIYNDDIFTVTEDDFNNSYMQICISASKSIIPAFSVDHINTEEYGKEYISFFLPVSPCESLTINLLFVNIAISLNVL